MKAPWRWLQEFVDLEMEPEELADRLTHRGLECTVEEQGALEGVVVGEILSVGPHPNADHLYLCRVRDGKSILTVVCGAPNTRTGMKAPLAKVGARLPDGFLVEARDIRGVRSEGMLCSEAELGVGEDASGLWSLPDAVPCGERVDEALGLRDWVLELELTPNRGDCLSILGLAYEVAAVQGSPIRLPQVHLDEQGDPLPARFQVIIQDPDLCPRYVARMIEGAHVQESPLWMRRRLQLVGIRPINNLVDVTNYVMWELGQPLHAFDMDLLEGDKIVVKRAREGERFTSLDGQERVLSGEMLMIWDGRKPVAVAGVMGGENSEVRPSTRRVLIESALFDPLNIRRTAKALGMATEASRRFEKGVDPEGCAFAADRAAQLMAQVSGGVVVSGRIDAHPKPRSPRRIPLRVRKVNHLLGTRLSRRQVRQCLERLSLRVEEDGGMLWVTPPSRRWDLEREVDLIEEVARSWGYDRIPSTLPRILPRGGAEDSMRRLEDRIREILVGMGFREIITYSFMDEKDLDRLGIGAGDPLRGCLHIRNPIRQDQGVMRTILLPGLLDTVRYNLNRKNTDLRLFELGSVFLPRRDRPLPREPRRLGVVMTGSRSPEHWAIREEPVDLFDLKGVLEGLLFSLNLPPMELDRTERLPFLQEGGGAGVLCGGKRIGWFGRIRPSVEASWDLNQPVFAFELDLEGMVERALPRRRFVPLPRYPGVVRDLSVVVKEDLEVGTILREIRQMGVKWLEEVFLFDLFTGGDRIPRGMKSLSFRIRFRALDRNLTDEEVNREQERLIRRLEERFGARLRR